MFRLKVDTRQMVAAFKRFLARIARLPQAINVPPGPWDLVNRYLERRMILVFRNKRDSMELKQSTIDWKRSHIGVLRPVAGSLRLPLLVGNVEAYGKQTGYSDRQLFAETPVGSSSTREVRDFIPGSAGRGSAFVFGIQLSGYHRGYPASILRPKDITQDIVEASGGDGSRALVHIDQADITIIGDMLFENYIQPQIRRLMGAV